MGEITKTDFKVFNGTDYDKKYFSTSADQVSFDAGSGSQADLQDVVTQLRTQDASMAQQLGQLPKFAIVDLSIPSSQAGQSVRFIPPSGFDMRKCVIIPGGYYTGSRTGANLTVYGLLDSVIFNSPGKLTYSAVYDGGSNEVVLQFSPPADLGTTIKLRLVFIQAGTIEDISVAAG